MSLPWIVKSDKTSHGGTVIEGDPAFDTHGKPVALVGHIHGEGIQMNSLLSCLILVFWAGCTFAAPSKQVIESCLRTEAVSNQVQYEDLKPNSFNQENDEKNQMTSNTIAFHNRQIGIWEAKNSKRFGLVYGDKKIPIRRVIQLGKDAPRAFNPYTAQWGEAHHAKNSYLCITFNFEGMGESGSFQNIRGVYLIATKAKRPRFFYAVGDIRKTSKHISR